MHDWEHQQQLEEQQQLQALPAYCDYLASVCRKSLNAPDPEGIIMGVSGIKHHVVADKLVSYTKRINVIDFQGRHYKITVEAL
jgi:hypothetical protein